MTPDERNRLIMDAMAQDPCWWEWASVRCECEEFARNEEAPEGRTDSCRPGRPLPDCVYCHGTGRVPRDFGLDENTFKLMEWAARQGWWDGICRDIDHAFSLLIGGIEAKDVAAMIRDRIAEALKEQLR